jgi:hypothetical protein
MLEANFFRVETTAPGGLVNGRIEFPGGGEQQIEESVLTTLDKCPDGSEIPLRKVNKGVMRVGIAGYPTSTSHVEVRFIPIPDDEYCKDAEQPPPTAKCELPKKGKNAACYVRFFQGHFYASAEGKGISCVIGSNRWRNPGKSLFAGVTGTQTDRNGEQIGPGLGVAYVAIPLKLKGKPGKYEFDDVSPAWSLPGPPDDGRAWWPAPDPDRPYASAGAIMGSNEGGSLKWDGKRSGTFKFTGSDKHVGAGGFVADNTAFARGRFHCKTITKEIDQAPVAPEGQ